MNIFEPSQKYETLLSRCVFMTIPRQIALREERRSYTIPLRKPLRTTDIDFSKPVAQTETIRQCTFRLFWNESQGQYAEAFATAADMKAYAKWAGET